MPLRNILFVNSYLWTIGYGDLVRGVPKIKHFACHRDFFVHEIPRIKHTQNALYPSMKHFEYVLYVGFHAQRNLCDKQNVLFYGTPRIKIQVVR